MGSYAVRSREILGMHTMGGRNIEDKRAAPIAEPPIALPECVEQERVRGQMRLRLEHHVGWCGIVDHHMPRSQLLESRNRFGERCHTGANEVRLGGSGVTSKHHDHRSA